MSISETYLLAGKARSKLNKEAAKADPSIRVLVSHANMLDNLMENIETYKQEQRVAKVQQRNVSILTNFKPTRSSNLQHTTTVTFVDDDDSSDDDISDDDIVEEDESAGVSFSSIDYDSDSDSDSDEEDDYEDDYEDSEEEVPLPSQSYLFGSHKNLNYRSLPTIDELSEEELQDLEDELTDSEDEEEEEFEENEHEADIVDIQRITSPPQLSYSSTDDSESESEEDYYEHDSQQGAKDQIKEDHASFYKGGLNQSLVNVPQLVQV